jgi:hypothetical protein
MSNLKIDNMDVMTGKFAADKTGMDKLFDLVEFSSNTTNGEIQLTNKNTRASTTVNSNAKPDAVAKLVLSKEEASLDLSGIDKFVQSFISAFNSHTQNAVDLILDPGYLNQGTSFTMAKNSFNTNTATLLSGAGYAVKKCVPATKVCYGTLNIKVSGVTYPAYMPIKQGADGKWRAYGDQAPFYIEFYPLYVHSESIDSVTKSAAVDKDTVGISLVFSGNSCGDCNDNKYKSSIFEMSTDGGTTYSTTLFKLASKTITNTDNSSYNISMGIDDGHGNVTGREWLDALGPYFLEIVNTQTISAYNTAFQSGQLKLRIKAYTNADYTGTSVVWEPPVLAPLFEPSSATAGLKAQQLTIDEKTLGTDSVTFTGKNLIDAYFSAYNPTNPNSSYGEYFSFEEASALNGIVTPIKIKTRCDKVLSLITNQTDINYQKNQCDALSATGLKINQAILISQNPQGGRIYLSKKISLKY